MATFDFSGGFVANAGVIGSRQISYTEGGVNFTWSISNGDGENYFNIGGGQFLGSRSGGDNGITQDIYTLDVTGVGQTRFDGAISFDVTRVTGSWTVNGQALTRGVNSLTGPQSSLVFTNTSTGVFNNFSITSLTATINCFLTDTRIDTPGGAIAVQDLQPGDRICTADGGETRVKWVGRQDMAPRFQHPAKINPVCIRAGALADGIPARDLFVTHDHAIALDGLLINAGALVNGSTIYTVAKMPLDGFSYYHVETDTHELLLAEGCAAETYLDLPNRDAFVNGAERADAPPIPEMRLPRVTTRRLVPDAITARLADRAGLRRVA